jgi:hypothetical protein
MSTHPRSRLVFRTDNTPKFSEEDVEKIELTAVTPNIEWNIGRRIVFESELKTEQYDSNGEDPANYQHLYQEEEEKDLQESPTKEVLQAHPVYENFLRVKPENVNSIEPSPGKISFAAQGSKQKPESFTSPQKSEASFRAKTRWSNKQPGSSGSKGNPFVSNNKGRLEDSPVGAFSGNKNSNRHHKIEDRTPSSVRVAGQKDTIHVTANGSRKELGVESAAPSTPKARINDKHVWVAEVKRETKLMKQKIEDFERKFEERTSKMAI